MPCDLATITNPQNFYFALYDFSLRVREDVYPGCTAYGYTDGEIRGRLTDFGITFTCDHIRGLGVTVYLNSYFVLGVNSWTLLNSNGDVNTTPNIIFVDMGAIENLNDDTDTDTIACPYFASIPERLREVFCTTETNDFSEGFAYASYFIYAADVEGDGLYWVFLWQDDVPPNNPIARCPTYFTYYTRSTTDGRLAGGGGTWVYGNTRQACGGIPPYNHFLPIMYVHSCARMFSNMPYTPTNLKEDYETLTGLFIGDEIWETQFNVDTIKKMLVTRVL